MELFRLSHFENTQSYEHSINAIYISKVKQLRFTLHKSFFVPMLLHLQHQQHEIPTTSPSQTENERGVTHQRQWTCAELVRFMPPTGGMVKFQTFGIMMRNVTIKSLDTHPYMEENKPGNKCENEIPQRNRKPTMTR